MAITAKLTQQQALSGKLTPQQKLVVTNYSTDDASNIYDHVSTKFIAKSSIKIILNGLPE